MAGIVTDFHVTQRCGEDWLKMSRFEDTSVNVVVYLRPFSLEPTRFGRQGTAISMVETKGEVELTVSTATRCMFSMSLQLPKMDGPKATTRDDAAKVTFLRL